MPNLSGHSTCDFSVMNAKNFLQKRFFKKKINKSLTAHRKVEAVTLSLTYENTVHNYKASLATLEFHTASSLFIYSITTTDFRA